VKQANACLARKEANATLKTVEQRFLYSGSLEERHLLEVEIRVQNRPESGYTGGG
jgi:hypothetical protein